MLTKGERISIQFIEEVLQTYHFDSVDFVYEPGQYARRGSIVDVFSYTAEYPYRIDFLAMKSNRSVLSTWKVNSPSNCSTR
jgi:transcription-repair coupling factor (superfamily II helicase)